MSSYILVHRKDVDKRWWNELVKACAVVGDTFEIHCWSDETAEIMAALRYGQKVKTSWSGGTVIRGRITREFLSCYYKFAPSSWQPAIGKGHLVA